MPLRLRILRSLLEQMLAHALAELPNECCGLLAGPSPSNQDRVPTAVRHYRLANAAASPREYLSDSHSMFDAVRDMRSRDFEILAIYHSHPTSHPVPSRTDLEQSYDPEVMNFIISLRTGEPVVRAWWLRGDDYCEAEWEVTEEDG